MPAPFKMSWRASQLKGDGTGLPVPQAVADLNTLGVCKDPTLSTIYHMQ